MHPLAGLADRWDEETALLRRLGDERGAALSNIRATELRTELVAIGAVQLTIANAALESGYSRSHLRRMVRDRLIPNAGTAMEPLILRANLPKKPGSGVAPAAQLMPSSRTQVARAVASQRGG